MRSSIQNVKVTKPKNVFDILNEEDSSSSDEEEEEEKLKLKILKLSLKMLLFAKGNILIGHLWLILILNLRMKSKLVRLVRF